MRIIADLHTHTLASGHAYSTVNELATAAAAKGLAALAITDHGPALPGGPHVYHFGAMRFIPPVIHGVRIFPGVEANIIDRKGQLDLPEAYLEKLDFIMAGLHEGCGFDNQGIVKNTDAIINSLRNPRIRAISHPGNPVFPVDYHALVEATRENGAALEINNSSLVISRKGSRPNCEMLARLVAEAATLVIVSSDAHVAQGVGEFEEALKLVASAGILEEHVVNSSMERLLAFLRLPLA